MTTTTLDVKGLSCPLPVLRANKAMKEMIPGDVLEILATDPDSPADFEVFCESTGNELLGVEDSGGGFVIQIRKAG